MLTKYRDMYNPDDGEITIPETGVWASLGVKRRNTFLKARDELKSLFHSMLRRRLF